MGIPRWRMAFTVLAQSFWVGIMGIILALPTVFDPARAERLDSTVGLELGRDRFQVQVRGGALDVARS